MSTTIEKPTELELAVVDEQSIKNKIYNIRGQQVMLDFDLAEIYGYEVKRLNEQVRRNIERFPEDFMFQLTKAEIQLISLKSQFATLNEQGNKRGMHIKKLPFAFTEQGIYMLATVLKGELAQAQSIALIRIFKSMKDYIVNNDYLIADKSLLALTQQTIKNTEDIAEIKGEMLRKSDLPELIKCFTETKIKNEYLIYNNELVEADLAYNQIYSEAQKTIFIVDNYINLKTLHLVKDVSSNVNVIVFSDNIGFGLTRILFADFKREFPNITVNFKQTCNKVHDRFIMLDFGTDYEKLYHCGASSKDAGARVTAISKLTETFCYRQLFNDLLSNPDLVLR